MPGEKWDPQAPGTRPQQHKEITLQGWTGRLFCIGKRKTRTKWQILDLNSGCLHTHLTHNLTHPETLATSPAPLPGQLCMCEPPRGPNGAKVGKWVSGPVDRGTDGQTPVQGLERPSAWTPGPHLPSPAPSQWLPAPLERLALPSQGSALCALCLNIPLLVS